ncbi:MAG: alpha/beta fold hydrolase [Chloroflexi bacterium]|nr:alpha/beta fold hydrolase [Chloroflexota bacterium]
MRLDLGDISINYELTGKGKLLTLVHGLGGSIASWESQVAEFSKKFQVLTWDVRGFGASDKPRGVYSAQMFADDLLSLLQKLGFSETFVLGHSMGGVIALRFTADHPEMVKGLIVASSASECNEAAAQRWNELADNIEKVGMTPVIETVERNFTPEFTAAHPDIVEQQKGLRLDNDPVAYAQAARAMALANLTGELGKIRCPVLFVVGDKDVNVGVGGSVRMHRTVAGSQLKILENCAHGIQVEKASEFNETVVEFLAQLEQEV